MMLNIELPRIHKEIIDTIRETISHKEENTSLDNNYVSHVPCSYV